MFRPISRRFAPITLAIVLSCAQVAWAQAVTPVPKLDDEQMRGTWYEIARLPTKREKSCAGNNLEIIARGDKLNQLQLVDSCKNPKGFLNVHNLTAKPQQKKNNNGDGRLKITTIWPFSLKYWVLAVDPTYRWSLIGSPNHRFLWIYSRTPTLDPATLAQIQTTAAAEGFATAKLVTTVQTLPPGQHPAQIASAAPAEK
jgi:apolipoprotein D and lipocalin family protein